MRHDFSAALGAWRDVRLAALQDELRALKPGVVEGQREALISRKALADRTREFKRQAPDAQLEGIRALLKAYQGEVDALTSRAKQAESVLLDINTRLDTAPDPYPVFESLVEHTASESDAAQLRKQLEKEKAERAELQRRATMAESRVASLTEQAAAAAADAQRDAAEAAAAAMQRVREREESLKRELSASQAQLRELRTSHEHVTMQLLSHGSADAARRGDSEQIEGLLSELQRANVRASQAERRVALARQDAEQAHASVADQHARRVARLEERISQQNEAHAQRVAALEHAAEETSKAARSDNEAQTRRADVALEQVASLRAQLAARSDYDELKREVDVLRAIEFGDDEASADNGSLEAHLVRRNHKLQDELATLRGTMAEERQNTTMLEKELNLAQARITELETLSRRLESDLLGLAAPAAEASSGVASLLPIVTNQRDRFRSRNAELESELRGNAEALAELRSQVRRLQSDNVGMYEKVRYLQNFQRRGSEDTPYAGDVEAPYRARYESSLHPFEVFRGREQSRAVARLSPVDRMLYMCASVILGNPYLRLGFVCYAILLHLLVFGILLDVGHRTM